MLRFQGKASNQGLKKPVKGQLTGQAGRRPANSWLIALRGFMQRRPVVVLQVVGEENLHSPQKRSKIRMDSPVLAVESPRRQ